MGPCGGPPGASGKPCDEKDSLAPIGRVEAGGGCMLVKSGQRVHRRRCVLVPAEESLHPGLSAALATAPLSQLWLAGDRRSWAILDGMAGRFAGCCRGALWHGNGMAKKRLVLVKTWL